MTGQNWSRDFLTSMSYTGLSSSTQPLQQTSSVWKYILPCKNNHIHMVPLTEVVSGGSRQSSQNFCIQSQEFRMEMSTQTCSFSNAASLPSPLRLVGPDSQNSRRYLRGGGGVVHSSPVQVFGRSRGVPVAVAIGGGIRGCLELEAGGGGGRGGGAIVLFCTY
jgi:hypothetical protein